MGSRASQLRNRQQVQDSSSAVQQAGDLLQADNNVKAISDSNGDSSIHNNNNNNNFADDVTMIKDALHAAAAIVQVQGNGDTQPGDALQQANGDHPSASRQSSKGSTLQRQASHIQSLAQRIRRSSSVRRFIPSCGNAKRKVSFAADRVLYFLFL